MTSAISSAESGARDEFAKLSRLGKRKRAIAKIKTTRPPSTTTSQDSSGSEDEYNADHTDFLSPENMEGALDPATAVDHVNTMQFIFSTEEALRPRRTSGYHRRAIFEAIEEVKHSNENSVRNDELSSLSDSEEDVEMQERARSA